MPRSNRPLPARDYLRSILDYDPTTGALTWKRRPDMPDVWNARFAGQTAGGLKGQGYVFVSIDGVSFLAHRVIWAWMYEDPGDRLVDHRNGVVSENWLDNLRCANDTQNQRNRKGRSKYGLPKGVEIDKRNGKYRAFLSLGSFDTVEDARAAYERVAAFAFGEFAHHVSVTAGSQNPSPTYERRGLPKGVSWSAQKGAFIARIRMDGKERHLGTFHTVDAASAAYQAARAAKNALERS